MNRRSLLVLLATMMVLPSVGLGQTKTHRVLFAVTSSNEQDWMMTAANIANLKKGMAPEEVDIEVVAYGPGVSMLKKDSAIAAQVQLLFKDGVKVVACENSMRRMQLSKSDLIAGVDTVPSGIVEVVRRQEAGWSYIKAGQ